MQWWWATPCATLTLPSTPSFTTLCLKPSENRYLGILVMFVILEKVDKNNFEGDHPFLLCKMKRSNIQSSIPISALNTFEFLKALFMDSCLAPTYFPHCGTAAYSKDLEEVISENETWLVFTSKAEELLLDIKEHFCNPQRD